MNMVNKLKYFDTSLGLSETEKKQHVAANGANVFITFWEVKPSAVEAHNFTKILDCTSVHTQATKVSSLVA